MAASLASILPTLAIAGVASGAPAVVDGDATCPTPASVAEALSLPGNKDPGGLDRVRVENSGPDVRITLQGQDGTTNVERTLPGRGSCADLARAAAVVVEVWMIERHPEWNATAALPAPAVEPPPSNVLPTPAPAVRASYEIDVFAGLATTQDSIVPALALEGARWAQSWGARVGISAHAPTTQSLGTGRARWMRWALWAGVTRRQVWGRWRLELDAGPGAGVTLAMGSGFVDNFSRASLSPIATVGAGFGRALGRSARLSLAIRATVWPWQEMVAADSAGSPEAGLPKWDLVSAIGLTW